MEWLFWQIGGLGPMAGQNHHFGVYAPEKIPYAIDRYVNEANRLYGVHGPPPRRPPVPRRRRLHHRRHGGVSVGRAVEAPAAEPGRLPASAPLVRRHPRIGPATLRAYAKGEPYSAQPAVTEEGKKLLFGQTAASVARA